MKYQWLLFDADGTLFDYDRAETVALERTFHELGLQSRPDYTEAYRRINAGIWLEFEQGNISQARLRTLRFERLFESIDIEADPLHFSQAYLEHLAQGTFLINGAESVLKSLHGKFGLAVITNGLMEVQRPRLARSAVGGYFQAITISEEVGAAKPDRRIFDAAFQMMGQPDLGRTLIIGDSLTSDMAGGIAYGIDTCWFNPDGRPRQPFLEVTYEISKLKELLPILGVSPSPSTNMRRLS